MMGIASKRQPRCRERYADGADGDCGKRAAAAARPLWSTGLGDLGTHVLLTAWKSPTRVHEDPDL